VVLNPATRPSVITKSFLKKIPRGQLAQNAILSLFWQGVRILLLTFWVIALARLLGAEGYGLYSGITGIAVALGCFSGLGLGLAMYQDVVITQQIFSARWQEALWITLISGFFFAFVFIALCAFIFSKISLYTLVAIGFSELIFYPLMTTSAFAFASKLKIGWSSAMPSLMALFRCLAILIFFAVSNRKTIDEYVWYHLAATSMASLLIILLVKKILRPEPYPLKLNSNNIRKGFSFCFSWASSNSIASLDKPIVLKLGDSEMAGLYSSSFRLATIFMQPIDALVNAATPKLFLSGANNHAGNPFIKYIFVSLIAYSFIAGIALLTLPKFFIWLLGPSFASAGNTIQLFSLLIPCYAMRVLGTHMLLTSNNFKLKLIAEMAGVCVLITLGAILIPTFGLQGAAIMAIMAELSIALICWVVILKKYTSNGRTV
jgi:O-antigen/teichoic acid export membrane protein